MIQLLVCIDTSTLFVKSTFCKSISFQTYLTHRQLALARARQLSNFFGVFFLLFVAVLVVLVICPCWCHNCCCCCYHFCCCCHSCLALLGREFIGLQKREGPHCSCNTSNQHTTKDTQNIKHIKHTNYQNDVHKTNTRKYTKHGNLIDKHNSVNKFLKSNRTRIKKEEWSVKSNTNWKKRKRTEKKRRKSVRRKRTILLNLKIKEGWTR